MSGEVREDLKYKPQDFFFRIKVANGGLSSAVFFDDVAFISFFGQEAGKEAAECFAIVKNEQQYSRREVERRLKDAAVAYRFAKLTGMSFNSFLKKGRMSTRVRDVRSESGNK